MRFPCGQRSTVHPFSTIPSHTLNVSSERCAAQGEVEWGDLDLELRPGSGDPDSDIAGCDMSGDIDAQGSDDEMEDPVGELLLDLEESLVALLDGTAGREAVEDVLHSQRVLTSDDIDSLMARPSGAATKSGEEGMLRAWCFWELFCKVERLSSDRHWPPSWQQWQDFLCRLRRGTVSCDAFRNVYTKVSTYGQRKFGGSSLGSLFGGRMKRLITILNRHYGSKVKQQAGITATEAKNFHKFVDRDCLYGLQGGAAFAFGVTGGGKRPRSVAAIKLSNVTVRVEEVTVGGVPQLVPAFTCTITDNKFSDIMGDRFVREWLLGTEQYEHWAERTASWWLYRLLVIRGAFSLHDPMENGGVHAGDVLEFKPSALFWFLLCHARGDRYVNTRPISTEMLSGLTATLLTRMGSEPRGYSAHRKGCVTRAMERELLQEGQGKNIRESLKDVLVRWGGWDILKGHITVAQRYVQQVLDRYIDGVGLGLGKTMTVGERAAKMKDCEGADLQAPNPAPCEKMVVHRPLLVRMLAYRDPEFQQHQESLDEAAKAIMAVGKADRACCLVDRDRTASGCFDTVLRLHATSALVKTFKTLNQGHNAKFRAAVKRAEAMVMQAHWQCTGIPIKQCNLSLVMSLLVPYKFGGFDNGCVVAKAHLLVPKHRVHPNILVAFVKM